MVKRRHAFEKLVQGIVKVRATEEYVLCLIVEKLPKECKQLVVVCAYMSR